MGVAGIVAGLALVVFGFDRMHTAQGRWRTAAAFLPLAGLALVGASILYLLVPGFFQL